MTDPTEIARVAAGLTRAQRYELQVATTTADQRCLVYVTDTPWPKGLCRYYSAKRDRLTELGLAVRDHILREKSGG